MGSRVASCLVGMCPVNSCQLLLGDLLALPLVFLHFGTQTMEPAREGTSKFTRLPFSSFIREHFPCLQTALKSFTRWGTFFSAPLLWDPTLKTTANFKAGRRGRRGHQPKENWLSFFVFDFLSLTIKHSLLSLSLSHACMFYVRSKTRKLYNAWLHFNVHSNIFKIMSWFTNVHLTAIPIHKDLVKKIIITILPSHNHFELSIVLFLVSQQISTLFLIICVNTYHNTSSLR